MNCGTFAFDHHWGKEHQASERKVGSRGDEIVQSHEHLHMNRWGKEDKGSQWGERRRERERKKKSDDNVLPVVEPSIGFDQSDWLKGRLPPAFSRSAISADRTIQEVRDHRREDKRKKGSSPG